MTKFKSSAPLADGHRLTISVDEFCKLAGVGKTYTWGLISQGKLLVVRVGRRTLISYASVIKLLTPELYDSYLASLPSAAPHTPPANDTGAE